MEVTGPDAKVMRFRTPGALLLGSFDFALGAGLLGGFEG